MEVVVQTDSIRIYHAPPYDNKWMTLEPMTTVFDVLNTIEKQSAWHSCTLYLSPPSNVASPMAAPEDPNEPYDDTVRFLNPGDWVDMGDHRMECEDFDIMSIPMNDSMMKLNPRAIHGGVFVLRLK